MNKIFIMLIVMIVATVSYAEVNMKSYDVGNLKVNMLIDSVSEGNPSDILVGFKEEHKRTLNPNGMYDTVINAFFIQTKNHNILIDSGFGINILDNLASLGITPGDVDTILLTHMHQDHIAGLLNKEEGMQYPNATVYIAQNEYDHWLALKKPSPNKIFKVYRGKINLFEPNILGENNEFIENITAWKAYGHTPGHTIYKITSNNESMLIIGDIIHAASVQLPYPEVATKYDTSTEDAIKTRVEVLKYAEQNNLPIAGMHMIDVVNNK